MATIDPQTYKDLREFTAQLIAARDRQASRTLLEGEYYTYDKTLLRNLDWSGGDDDFATRLVIFLLEYGKLENNILAIEGLLQLIERYGGLDTARAVGQIRTSIEASYAAEDKPAPNIYEPAPSAVLGSTTKLNPISAVLPQPFEWEHVDEGVTFVEYGSFELTKDAHDGGKDIHIWKARKQEEVAVPAFRMAKYPITNAQFAVFANMPDGYDNPIWWDFSEKARQWRSKHSVPEEVVFSDPDAPRVQVCWYQAVAFCHWLSAQIGYEVTLPTEAQWQRAAVADFGWRYPWGNGWIASYSNNSTEVRSSGPTPVTAYSTVKNPFKITDMVGNAWEWCLNVFSNHSMTTLDFEADYYPTRGGSWVNPDPDLFCATGRLRVPSTFVEKNVGFRIVRK